VYKGTKREIEGLEEKRILGFKFEHGDIHKRTSMAPAARVNCQA
jgi:hypothetical protein